MVPWHVDEFVYGPEMLTETVPAPLIKRSASRRLNATPGLPITQKDTVLNVEMTYRIERKMIQHGSKD